MNIGKFTKQPDGALFGSLPTMGFHEVSLEKVRKMGNGPDYRATVEGAELGAAWEQATKEGRKYLSFQVQVPGQARVYVAIFQTETEGDYVAVWSEPKAKADQAEA